MSEEMIETVQVASEVSDDNPLGFIVINKEDFNADIHKLFDAQDGQEVSEAKPRGRKPKQVEGE